MQIWQFSIQGPEQPFIVEMPRGAHVVAVDVTDEGPKFWAIVNPDAEKEQRKFIVVPTGTSFGGPWEHHGVIQGDIGVFHLMESMGKMVEQVGVPSEPAPASPAKCEACETRESRLEQALGEVRVEFIKTLGLIFDRFDESIRKAVGR